MSEDEHHHHALIETARSELERAHAGALAMVAGDMRRALRSAQAVLREADAVPGAVPTHEAMPGAMEAIAAALTKLDAGELAEMEHDIETARALLNA